MRYFSLVLATLALTSTATAQLCREHVDPIFPPTAPPRFGASVGLSDIAAVIGSPEDNFLGDSSGSASFYARTLTSGALTLIDTVTASDGRVGDRFGSSVAVDGDIAVIGAPTQDAAGQWLSGAAYVFRNINGVWSEEAKLTAAPAIPQQMFGRSVAISGNRIAVGATSGTYVFDFNGSHWAQQATLPGNGYSVDVEDNFVVSSGNGGIFRFDPALNIWIQERAISSVTAAIDGNVAAFVGWQAEYYERDAVTGSWGALGSTLLPGFGGGSRASLSGGRLALADNFGDVLVVSGYPGANSSLYWIQPARPINGPSSGGHVDVIVLGDAALGGLPNWDSIGRAYLYDLTCIESIISTTPCTQTVSNSTGTIGLLDVVGSLVLVNNDATLIAHNLPPNSFGFFIASRASGVTVAPGSAVGNLCLTGNIGRYVAPGQIMSSGAFGRIELALDLSSMPTPSGSIAANAGETWFFQAWHRDAIPMVVSNFTNSASVTWQ
ncbi:MAG: FG-GAP repeat protein [Planctomycetota bacterium]